MTRKQKKILVKAIRRHFALQEYLYARYKRNIPWEESTVMFAEVSTEGSANCEEFLRWDGSIQTSRMRSTKTIILHLYQPIEGSYVQHSVGQFQALRACDGPLVLEFTGNILGQFTIVSELDESCLEYVIPIIRERLIKVGRKYPDLKKMGTNTMSGDI